MSAELTTLDILRKARRLVARGWAKRRRAARDEHGRLCYCAVGAIDRASGQRLHPRPDLWHWADVALDETTASRRNLGARRDAYHALEAAMPGFPIAPSIPTWNDHRETTQADVLAAFDRAIATLEAQA